MKINLPKFLTVRKRKKLRATTARKPLRIAATADYDEMTEPNMKLSRALLIVLVLHVVAVSGIIAFNAIKTRQGSASNSSPAAPAASVGPSKVEGTAATSTLKQKEAPRHDDIKSSTAMPKSGGPEVRKAEHPKAVAVSSADAGKFYVVVKGDNPVSIAKKLKVSYDDLLAVNHITDPHKLQIGQKLLIPKTTRAAKKGDE